MVINCVSDAATVLPSMATSSAASDDLHHCRSVPSIIFSCASAMFLCTWVALHLDVPKNPRQPRWKRLLRRVRWMALAILAPEGVLAWAFIQWVNSCVELAKLLEKYPNCGWTETHAMLAAMGGFRLASDDKSNQLQLEGKYFNNAIGGDIEIPTSKEDAIQYRSKGDKIARAVAVIQTLWFGIQAAHRVSSGFDVTKLEITTLAHVVLNIFIYFFWWNKPLNVRFPVDVYPKKSEDKRAPSSGGATNNNLINNTGQDPESQMPLRPSLPFRVRIGMLVIEGSPDDRLTSIIFIFIFYMLIMFGAIHCLAWNSPFPTHTERILWRVCAPIVTVAPFLGLLIVGHYDLLPSGRFEKRILLPLGGLLALAYPLARICLLVISLTSLRALPYKAYQNPSWSL